jgi:hypothetical protein
VVVVVGGSQSERKRSGAGFVDQRVSSGRVEIRGDRKKTSMSTTSTCLLCC